MSKFLDAGYTLEQVDGDGHRKAGEDHRPGAEKLGTLQVGAPSNVSMLELVREPVEFVDTRNNAGRARNG